MTDDIARKISGTPADALKAAIVREARGMQQEDVVNATLSVALEAIYQNCNRRRDAEAKVDELMARFKSTLLDRYDRVSGKRHSSPIVLPN